MLLGDKSDNLHKKLAKSESLRFIESTTVKIKKQNDNYQQQINELLECIDILRQENQDLEKDQIKLKESAIESIVQRDEQIQMLQEKFLQRDQIENQEQQSMQNQILQQQYQMIEQLKEQLNQQQNFNKEEITIIQGHQFEVAKHKDHENKLSQEITELQLQIKTLEQKLCKQEMEKYRVAKNLDMTEKMLVDKDNHISELIKVNQDMKESINRIIQKHEKQIEDLKESHQQQLNNQFFEQELLNQQIQKQKKEYKAQLQNQLQEQDILNRKIHSKKQENLKLEEENKKFQEQIEELQIKLKGLENSNKKNEEKQQDDTSHNQNKYIKFIDLENSNKKNEEQQQDDISQKDKKHRRTNSIPLKHIFSQKLFRKKDENQDNDSNQNDIPKPNLIKTFTDFGFQSLKEEMDESSQYKKNFMLKSNLMPVNIMQNYWFIQQHQTQNNIQIQNIDIKQTVNNNNFNNVPDFVDSNDTFSLGDSFSLPTGSTESRIDDSLDILKENQSLKQEIASQYKIFMDTKQANIKLFTELELNKKKYKLLREFLLQNKISISSPKNNFQFKFEVDQQNGQLLSYTNSE